MYRSRQNFRFLVFEEGPSVDVVLQWATCQDASGQNSLCRIPNSVSEQLIIGVTESVFFPYHPFQEGVPS